MCTPVACARPRKLPYQPPTSPATHPTVLQPTMPLLLPPNHPTAMPPTTSAILPPQIPNALFNTTPTQSSWQTTAATTLQPSLPSPKEEKDPSRICPHQPCPSCLSPPQGDLTSGELKRVASKSKTKGTFCCLVRILFAPEEVKEKSVCGSKARPALDRQRVDQIRRCGVFEVLVCGSSKRSDCQHVWTRG